MGMEKVWVFQDRTGITECRLPEITSGGLGSKYNGYGAMCFLYQKTRCVYGVVVPHCRKPIAH